MFFVTKICPFFPPPPTLSLKTWRNQYFLVFSPPLYNGSFVFSESNTQASPNVLLFYVTTEVVVTCWPRMNKYIYLAAKPAYTFES